MMYNNWVEKMLFYIRVPIKTIFVIASEAKQSHFLLNKTRLLRSFLPRNDALGEFLEVSISISPNNF